MAKDAVILISNEHPAPIGRVEQNGGNPDPANSLECFKNGQRILNVFLYRKDGTERQRMDPLSGV